jgi:hypothetical protein
MSGNHAPAPNNLISPEPDCQAKKTEHFPVMTSSFALNLASFGKPMAAIGSKPSSKSKLPEFGSFAVCFNASPFGPICEPWLSAAAAFRLPTQMPGLTHGAFTGSELNEAHFKNFHAGHSRLTNPTFLFCAFSHPPRKRKVLEQVAI